MDFDVDPLSKLNERLDPKAKACIHKLMADHSKRMKDAQKTDLKITKLNGDLDLMRKGRTPNGYAPYKDRPLPQEFSEPFPRAAEADFKLIATFAKGITISEAKRQWHI